MSATVYDNKPARILSPEGVGLFIFFGLIATGKSTLAQDWAAKWQMSYYNSDRVRKELAGLAAHCRRHESLNQGIYTREFSRKTYDAMLERAENDLRRGQRVVLDGSYQDEAERERVRKLAEKCGVDLRFILCQCPETVIRERLEQRTRDPEAVSDGRWEIYLKQKEKFCPPAELPPEQLLIFSTFGPPDKLLNELGELTGISA